MRSIFLLYLIIPMIGICQHNNSGIQFQSGLSWQEIQAKAKAENKFIFMDCYATWCGPCKFMADNIFTQKEVGQYMNDHFISVAVQVDRTPNDANDVRKWYEDAKSIVKQYSINELPTYLFFSPDGKPVHRVIGVTGKEGTAFIAKAKDALDPDRQYYSLVGNYKMHLHDSAFLRRALACAVKENDVQNAEDICNAYARSLHNDYTVNSLILMDWAIRSSRDTAFYLYLNNTSGIDSALHRIGFAERKISSIIANEDIIPKFSENRTQIVWSKIVDTLEAKYPHLNDLGIKQLFNAFENQILLHEIRIPLYREGAGIADWGKVYDYIKQKYPGYDPEKMIAKEKPRYYSTKEMWLECEQTALAYMSKFGNELSNSELNSVAWEYAFLHSTNKDLLLKAAEWSKRSIPDESDKAYKGSFENIDTYANILFKLGHREEAILWEKRAYDLALKFPSEISTQKSYRITLDRMKEGKKTWEGRDENSSEYQ